MMGRRAADERAPSPRADSLHPRRITWCWCATTSCRCSKPSSTSCPGTRLCPADRRQSDTDPACRCWGVRDALLAGRAITSTSRLLMNARWRPCYHHHGHHGDPKGSISATASWCRTPSMSWGPWRPMRDSRCCSDDVRHAHHSHVPRPRLGRAPMWRPCWGEAGHPGRYEPNKLVRLYPGTRGELLPLHCRPSGR